MIVGYSRAGGAVNHTALDGSAIANAMASSVNVTLTTSNANDLIVLCIVINGGPVTTVSDVAGLTWTRRVRVDTTGGGTQYNELWTAVSPGALSSDVITVNCTSSDFVTAVAFGISGANTSTVFDSNVSLPATTGGGGGTCSVSTSNANDFIFGMYRLSTPSDSAGTGFTLIQSADFIAVEYKTVTSTQSGLSVAIASGSPHSGIADAVISS